MTKEFLESCASAWVSMASNDVRGKLRDFISKGYSINDLSEMLSIPSTEINSILNSNRNLDLMTFAKILISTNSVLEIKPLGVALQQGANINLMNPGRGHHNPFMHNHEMRGCNNDTMCCDNHHNPFMHNHEMRGCNNETMHNDETTCSDDNETMLNDETTCSDNSRNNPCSENVNRIRRKVSKRFPNHINDSQEEVTRPTPRATNNIQLLDEIPPLDSMPMVELLNFAKSNNIIDRNVGIQDISRSYLIQRIEDFISCNPNKPDTNEMEENEPNNDRLSNILGKLENEINNHPHLLEIFENILNKK